MKISSTLASIVPYVALAIIIILAICSRQVSMPGLFNSDSLYLSALFDGLFLNGESFSSWNLTPSPYFFPDMALFFAVKALFRDAYTTFIAYAVFQNAFVLYLAGRLSLVGNNLSDRRFLVYVIYVLAISLLAVENLAPYLFALISAYHFGLMINGLILLSLITSIKKQISKTGLFSMFLVAAIGAASDLLFIMQVTVPVVGSLILLAVLGQAESGSSKWIVLALILGTLVGVVTKFCVTVNTVTHYILRGLDDLPSQLEFLYVGFKASAMKNPFTSLYSLLFYIVIAIQIYLTLVKEKMHRPALTEQWPLFLKVFILVSVLVTLVAVVINGVLAEIIYWNSRYLINVYWYPIIFCWLPVSSIVMGPKTNAVFVVAIIAVVTFCVFSQL